MFRKRILSSVLAVGMFVGACDVTALYPGAPQAFELNAFDVDKLSVLLSEPDDPPDPPGGVKDPPGPL